MVGRRFHDLLSGLLDGDQGPAEIGHGGQVGELAQDVVEDVEAVADGDREQVGAVCLVEHVGVGLDHAATRDRQPDHGRREDLADVSVAEQLLDVLDRRGLASLQPDDGAHLLLGGVRGHRSGVVEVAAEWPLAVDGLAGGKCGGDELSMVRDLDRNSDHVDVGLGHQLAVV